MQRIDDIGRQTFVKQKSEQIVAVMSCGFQSCFCFAQIFCDGLDSAVQAFKTIEIIWNGEHIMQNLTFGVDDKAVMLVLCDVDSDIDHIGYPQ